MNRHPGDMDAPLALRLVLTACFFSVVSGCALAERDRQPSQNQPSERITRRGVGTTQESRATPDQPLDRPQNAREPAVRPVTGAAKAPRRVEASPSPAPGDGQPRDAKTVEKRLEEAIAEIQKEQTVQAEQQLIQEITGLIVEETMTKIGYEFYECFFLRWEPPEVQVKAYNVLISEKATPMWGSIVEVKIGDTTVFGRMLKPRSEEIEEAVQEAIAATRQYLENYEQQQSQTPDLSPSGI